MVPYVVEELLPLPEIEGDEVEPVPPVPTLVEELLPLPGTEEDEPELVPPVPTMVEELLRILEEDKGVDDPSPVTVLVDEIVPPEEIVENEAEVEVETCCESVSVSVIE